MPQEVLAAQGAEQRWELVVGMCLPAVGGLVLWGMVPQRAGVVMVFLDGQQRELLLTVRANLPLEQPL